MEDQQLKLNKKLVVVLVSLSILSAILVVAIIIVLIVKNINNEALSNTTGDDETALYFDGMDEEEYQEAQRMEQFEKMHNEVKELLEQTPVDTKQINELYDEFIALAVTEERRGDAIYYINTRTEDYLSKDLKQEALDALLTVDFGVYTAPDQYRLYSNVIELAESVGDNDTVKKYNDLRSTVEYEYLEDYESTRDAQIEENNDEYVDGEDEEFEE